MVWGGGQATRDSACAPQSRNLSKYEKEEEGSVQVRQLIGIGNWISMNAGRERDEASYELENEKGCMQGRSCNGCMRAQRAPASRGHENESVGPAPTA